MLTGSLWASMLAVSICDSHHTNYAPRWVAHSVQPPSLHPLEPEYRRRAPETASRRHLRVQWPPVRRGQWGQPATETVLINHCVRQGFMLKRLRIATHTRYW